MACLAKSAAAKLPLPPVVTSGHLDVACVNVPFVPGHFRQGAGTRRIRSTSAIAGPCCRVKCRLSDLPMSIGKMAQEAPQSTSKDQQSKAQQRKAEQSRAEQSRAEQSRAEQSRAEQSRAEQSRAEQSRAEQSRAEQSRAEQSRAEQSRAEQSRAEQSRVLPEFMLISGALDPRLA